MVSGLVAEVALAQEVRREVCPLELAAQQLEIQGKVIAARAGLQKLERAARGQTGRRGASGVGGVEQGGQGGRAKHPKGEQKQHKARKNVSELPNRLHSNPT